MQMQWTKYTTKLKDQTVQQVIYRGPFIIDLLHICRTKGMPSSKLQRRAEANMTSKSTLVIWGATETLQYKNPPYRVSRTMGVLGGGNA